MRISSSTAPRRRDPKLPAFTKNLNASQRSCLTKFTRTGERDMTKNLKASQHAQRKAAWASRMEKEAA